MKLLTLTTAAIASAILIAPLAALPATAQSQPNPIVDEATLRLQLVDAGVDPKFHDSLVSTALAGGQWKAASGAAPTSTTTFESEGYMVTLREFADGSRLETGVEIGTPATPEQLAVIVAEARPFVLGIDKTRRSGSLADDLQVAPLATGITGCTYGTSAGVYYASNCHVYYSGINWSSSFRANYQRWSGNAKAQYRVGTAQTVTWLSVNNEVVQSLDNSRRIRYSMNLSAAGWGNAPFRLDLVVTPTTAYATYS
ncbi:hypothetical protein [Microcella sp.]|uniref:hypothetical protein n=1 Tax=Microcella sp. TaxID=1913979 RepID=UPI00299F7102|nr:hypothetical protein [Microcella sp.]MDX2026799.1 hypothetical protein [Microcella sp.]